MARLVQIMGVQHNPLLVPRFRDPEGHQGIPEAIAGFEQMHQKMAEARPDVLLVIGNDHLNQLFWDNMPPFLIGKAPEARGPFPHEMEMYGIPAYQTRVDVDVARAVLVGGFDHGVDFAFSDEFLIDHAFTVPLTYVRPEADLPIVPLFTNVMSPPLPPARRFYQVGEALRAVIEELPRDLRVGVLASGHLSVEVGGPNPMREAPDPEFDARMVELIGRGDVDGMLREATFERMMRAGNFTTGFLNFVMLVGVACGKPASQAEYVLTDTSSTPFLTWDLHRD